MAKRRSKKNNLNKLAKEEVSDLGEKKVTKTVFKKFTEEETTNLELKEEKIVEKVKMGGSKQTPKHKLSPNRPH